MMSCIVIFHILFATVSAHSLKSYSLVESLFQDPKAFAATFEKANPEAVQSVIDLVNDLIAEGQDKKANIIAEHEDAIVATTDAKSELAVALDELETAAGERVEADEEVVRLQGVLVQKQTAESDASAAKVAATGVLTDSQNWMDSEVTRVDKEKASLEEVKDILAQLPSGFRRLLSASSSLLPLGMLSSMSKTDPEAVAQLVGLVDDLVAAGEQVRTDVTQARDDAQVDLNTKTQTWNDAVSATAVAEDTLAAGQTDAGNKLVVQNAKREVFDAATSKKDSAVALEAEKKGVRDTQVPILDHEDEQLNEVNGILTNLLPQE